MKTLLILIATITPATATPTIPPGVFSLVGNGAPIASASLANPNVDGIAIRQKWANVNPSPGVFNWAYLDTEIARARAAGKAVLLRIADGGNSIPRWVLNGAATRYSYRDTDGSIITIPVFWDAYFLAKKQTLIAAVGARFSGNPAVRIASFGVANSRSADWFVPHNPTNISDWHRVGYTSQKLINASNTTIGAEMAAFPNQVIVMAQNPNGNLDPSPDYLSAAVISNGRAQYGDRLVVDKYNLSAKTPVAPPPNGSFWSLWYQSRPAVGAQMLWNCANDSSYRMNGGVPADPSTVLLHAVRTGLGYGAHYQEIYQIDVLNLTAAIAQAHTLLTSP